MINKKTIDFTKIEWAKIDKEKAEFIYNEAIARLDSIHRNNDAVTNKAQSMLSLALPILTAITGYFVLQWGNLSTPLLFMSVCSAVLLFAILVLLLLILVPRGINSAQGEPSAYFSDDYYLNSMENIFKGNIQEVNKYIREDSGIQIYRANLFRAAVIVFALFPIVAAGVWAVTSAYMQN